MSVLSVVPQSLSVVSHEEYQSAFLKSTVGQCLEQFSDLFVCKGHFTRIRVLGIL